MESLKMKYIEPKGAREPKVDKRDYCLRAGVSEFPESWVCEELMPVKNQKQVQSCVAHATATILEMLNKKETGQSVRLSTDFIYGMQYVAFGRENTGMYLREACKILKNYGDVLETTIPNNTEQPKCGTNLQSKLTEEIYTEAANYKVKSYARCKTENDIKHALMNYGPVLVSIRWYDKYKLKNKIITMDKTSSAGNHAVLVYGWNEQGWLCQNSWGRHWNGDGRFIYPYTEEFREAWSFVDAENTDIIVPKRGNILDIAYKVVNFIINLFKKN